MKLSLAVFCLINQVSAACDFNTDKDAIKFNSENKGTISDITITEQGNNIIRIQRTGKEKTTLELPLLESKMDADEVRCDFKTIYMTDDDSGIAFSAGVNRDAKLFAGM